MSMAIHSQAQIKLNILDKWQCGEDICMIAIDPDKRLVLLLSDKYGIYSISYHGKVLWKRKDM